jgi:hypothetical protein
MSNTCRKQPGLLSIISAQQSVKKVNAIDKKWSFGYSSLDKVNWSVLDRTALVIVKLCTAGDVARMGTLSASTMY